MTQIPSQRKTRVACLAARANSTASRDKGKQHLEDEATWRPKLAANLRALKIENNVITEQRKANLRTRFPDITNLPTSAAPKWRYLQHWSPVINSAAVLPVFISLMQWGTRVAMEETMTLMIGKSSAEVLVRQIMQYSAASCAAEWLRIINAPLIANWKNTSVQRFYDKVVKITIRDERIWAIQEDRKARHADLSYGASQTVGNAVAYVQGMVDNSVAVVVLLLSTTLGVASFGLMGIVAPLLGLAVLTSSQRFVQAPLREREMEAEMRLNLVDDSMNDHLQINNTYNWQLWQKQAKEADGIARNARFWHAFARTTTDAAVAGINTAGIIANQLGTVRRTADTTIDAKFVAATARDVRKVNEVSHRLTEISKGVSSYSTHSGWLREIDKRFRSAPTEQWSNRALNMMDRIDDIHIITSNISSTADETNEKEEGTTKLITAADLLKDPRKYLGAGKHGRFTITGANGVGKTTLMNVLASKLGEDKHYISVDSMLEYESGGGSAGEKTLNHLAETIEKITDKPVILLDEWPANLSAENTFTVKGLLDTLAKHVCVVEIVHYEHE